MASEAMGDGPGARALVLMDKLLAERPEKVGHDFSEATRSLTALREEIIQAVRAHDTPHERTRLDVVNRVLTAVMGGHFPLGGVPWKHVESGRDALRALLTEGRAGATV